MITAIRLEFLKLHTTRIWLGLLALGGGLTSWSRSPSPHGREVRASSPRWRRSPASGTS